MTLQTPRSLRQPVILLQNGSVRMWTLTIVSKEKTCLHAL